VLGSSNENDEDCDVGTVAGGAAELKNDPPEDAGDDAADGDDESARAVAVTTANAMIKMRKARVRRIVVLEIRFAS